MSKKSSRRSRNGRFVKKARAKNPYERKSAAVSRPRRHRNPPPLADLGGALLWGGAGYAASKGLGVLFDKYAPQSIPHRTMIGTAVAAGGAAWIASTSLKLPEKAAPAVVVGAMIPLAEELIALTPIGPMIGVYDAGNIPGLPSSSQSPTMQAALEAALQDNDEDYENSTAMI